ncbi:hypothetical protein ALC62_07266 [Cyphomyrmex costatus]|uniref:Uncharacterized protein n=1 Tax=Cyphomyrmex costatus TaxID=456900 RepID=A0A195CML6_9HYME|nr:hypothetical protein ALC62_07266 [Cyphomyrmex costatus]
MVGGWADWMGRKREREGWLSRHGGVDEVRGKGRGGWFPCLASRNRYAAGNLAPPTPPTPYVIAPQRPNPPVRSASVFSKAAKVILTIVVNDKESSLESAEFIRVAQPSLTLELAPTHRTPFHFHLRIHGVSLQQAPGVVFVHPATLTSVSSDLKILSTSPAIRSLIVRRGVRQAVVTILYSYLLFLDMGHLKERISVLPRRQSKKLQRGGVAEPFGHDERLKKYKLRQYARENIKRASPLPVENLRSTLVNTPGVPEEQQKKEVFPINCYKISDSLITVDEWLRERIGMSPQVTRPGISLADWFTGEICKSLQLIYWCSRAREKAKRTRHKRGGDKDGETSGSKSDRVADWTETAIDYGGKAAHLRHEHAPRYASAIDHYSSENVVYGRVSNASYNETRPLEKLANNNARNQTLEFERCRFYCRHTGREVGPELSAFDVDHTALAVSE